MFDLVKGFSGVIDMVNTTLASHHQRTAVVADQICLRLSLPPEEHHRVVISAMLHDVGVIPLHDRTDNLVFEKEMTRHSQAGYLMLRTCPVLYEEARVLLYHHTDWQMVRELPEAERAVGVIGNLVHLADSVDVHSRLNPELDYLRCIVKNGIGRSFEKTSAEAVLDFMDDPAFYDMLENSGQYLDDHPTPELILKDEDVTVFSMLFSHVIDSRSPFTATHSTGVAWIGRALHQLAWLDDADRSTMFVAGLLHDIGKIGVPNELIEKPGPLDNHEFKKVSHHAQLSLDVLGGIPGFEKVTPWGALHHEKLNGRGYPNGLTAERIPTESRLMAVADVMTALTEDRPYRAGLDEDKTMSILSSMVEQGGLDGDLVQLVRDNYGEVNEIRRQAQSEAAGFFRNLTDDIKLRCPDSRF
ncbi:phosphohydrolase [Deltaproteobacteria bacterium Smac51]|nr:phosphohydrolase [Deltaproteobacteria bacterium Smac51]